MVDFNGGGGVVGMDVNGWNAPGYDPGMAAAAANRNAVLNQAAGYDPFASGGGFGRQTADYSALGAAYGRNTGGFGGGASLQGPAGSEGWWSTYVSNVGPEAARRYLQNQGGDAGTAQWGSEPMVTTPDFEDRFPGSPYSGLPAEIDFGKSNPPNAYAPVATPQPRWDATGLQGNRGGGAWDQTDQWGRSYAPSGGYTPPEMLQGPPGSGGWWSNFLAAAGPERARQWLADNGHSTAGGGGNDTSNQFGQRYAPTAPTPQAPAQPLAGTTNGQMLRPDYNGDMWGGRNSIANTMVQQGTPYPGSGGLNQRFGFEGSPGGYMTSGDPGAGIGGWGYGGAQVQGQQPAPWFDPFGSTPIGGG